MGRLYSNNYSTTITSATIDAVATTVTVASEVGLPLVGGTDYVYLTLTDSLTAPTKTEIVKCTGNAAGTLSITRAQEGTTAHSWVNGDFIELRATADSFERADGTEFYRYTETWYNGAGNTIDRANGGMQTVVMSADASYSVVMEDTETMTVEFLNTDAWVPTFTGINFNEGAQPVCIGGKTLFQFVKINGYVYGMKVGDFNA